MAVWACSRLARVRGESFGHALGAGEDEQAEPVAPSRLGIYRWELAGFDQVRQFGHKPTVLTEPDLEELVPDSSARRDNSTQ